MNRSLAVWLLFPLFPWLPLFIGMPASADDNLKAFPPAEQGMVRRVVWLTQHPNESDLRVELVVGKTLPLDQINQYFFAGKIQSLDIDGWGFTKYVVKTLGPMAGTLIGVQPDAPQVDRFISLGGEPLLIRYNSKLPIVVYVPQEAEVRYRVWRADPEFKTAQSG